MVIHSLPRSLRTSPFTIRIYVQVQDKYKLCTWMNSTKFAQDYFKHDTISLCSKHTVHTHNVAYMGSQAHKLTHLSARMVWTTPLPSMNEGINNLDLSPNGQQFKLLYRKFEFTGMANLGSLVSNSNSRRDLPKHWMTISVVMRATQIQ